MQSKRLLAAALSLAVLGLALVAIGVSSFHRRTTLLQASSAPHAATLRAQQLRVKSAKNGARRQETQMLWGGFKNLINNVIAKHNENVDKFKATVQNVKNSVEQQGIKGTFLDIFDDGKINNLNGGDTTRTLAVSNDPDAPGPSDNPSHSVDEPADDPGDSVSASEDEIDVTDGVGDVSGPHAYTDEYYNVWNEADAMFDNAEVDPAPWQHAYPDHGVSAAEYAQWFQGHE